MERSDGSVIAARQPLTDAKWTKNGTRPHDAHWSYRSAGVGARRGVGAAGNAVMSLRRRAGSSSPGAAAFTLVFATFVSVVVAQTPPPPNALTPPSPPPLPPGFNGTGEAVLTIPQVKEAALERVLSLGRFTKPPEQCYFRILEPPTVAGADDRFFLLPPGKTWGTLPFGFANLTDSDFGSPGANPTGSEELIVDFELVRSTVPSPASRSLLDRPHSAVSLRAELPSRPPDPPPTRLPFSPFSSTPARETPG